MRQGRSDYVNGLFQLYNISWFRFCFHVFKRRVSRVKRIKRKPALRALVDQDPSLLCACEGVRLSERFRGMCR